MQESCVDEFGLKYFAQPSDAILSGVEIRISNIDHCDKLTRDNWPIESFIELLWHELYSEYDARLFSGYLHSSQVRLSTEFVAFEQLWLRDENSHCLGFKHLLAQLLDLTTAEIDDRLEHRSGDFSPLAHWLRDEFSACVLLAYDESVTAQAYRMDFPIYRSLGCGPLTQWIHRIVLDEVFHFSNITNIIKNIYSHRSAEIRHVLDELVQFDLDSSKYTGTFILDHTGFSPILLSTARESVLRKCSFP